jgi:cell shape-determining protein MreC
VDLSGERSTRTFVMEVNDDVTDLQDLKAEIRRKEEELFQMKQRLNKMVSE